MDNKNFALNDGAVSAIADLARMAGGVDVKTVTRRRDGDVPVLVVPKDVTTRGVADIVDAFEKTQPVPYRRRGTFIAADVASLVKWLSDNEPEGDFGHSPVFASGLETLNGEWRKPLLELIGIINYSSREDAEWHDFKALHSVAVSFPWSDWGKRHVVDPQDPEELDKWFEQAEFAEFINDHIHDVDVPRTGEKPSEAVCRFMEATKLKDVATPSQLVDLSRGLKMYVKGDTEVRFDPQSGEGSLQYTEEHKGEGGRPLKIPALFYIRIPVFFGRDPVLIGVRLRYRANGGKVLWSYSLFAPEIIVKEEFEKVISFVRNSGRVVYLGRPDSNAHV